MIAAHPDDENTALLAWLARGRKVRTGYLSLTRGEGGQNLIGPEQGALLGVIRTQELLAARRIDGAEQFFTSAVDFGYSKSADEALTKWDRDRMLGEIVQVIRTFQPDVIILRFSGTPRDGHGQHQASAILGKEAFEAAADPRDIPSSFEPSAPGAHGACCGMPSASPRHTVRKPKPSGTNYRSMSVNTTNCWASRIQKSQARAAACTRARRWELNSSAAPVTNIWSTSRENGHRKTFSRVCRSRRHSALREAARTFDWRHPERTIPLLCQSPSGAEGRSKAERSR